MLNINDIEYNKKKKFFVRFLRKKNVYNQFAKNFINRHGNFQYKLKERMEKYDFSFAIISAFDWEATKEGTNFWRDIHNSWRRYIVNIR